MVWSAHQEDWRSGITAARAYASENGDLLVPYLYVTKDGFRLGRWITRRRSKRRRGALTTERVAELDALGMVWDRGEEGWLRWLAKARAYREANGDLRASEGALATWLERLRSQRRRGVLPSERIAELDALGMAWDPYDEDWQRGISAARAYRESHGDLVISAKHITADGFRLGGWISARRLERRRGQLPDERVAELDSLGMAWDPYADDWERGITAARAYREANGHLRFPGGYLTSDGIRLERWIVKRRSEKRQGLLSNDRIAELDALGMAWEPLEEDWQRWLEAARSFSTDHGHLRVPTPYKTPDGLKLGVWISSRRTDRRRGRLSDRRIAELDALGIDWNPPRGTGHTGLT